MCVYIYIYIYVCIPNSTATTKKKFQSHSINLSLSSQNHSYLLHLTFHFTKCNYDYKEEYKQENILFGYAIWNMNLRYVILLHIITIGIIYLGVRFGRFRGSWYVEMWRKSLDTRNSTNNYTPV